MCCCDVSLCGCCVQRSPCWFTSESSHLIHLALVVRRYRRHPICSASSFRHAAHLQRTVRRTGSLWCRVASVCAHLALRLAICVDQGVENLSMSCLARCSVLAFHVAHSSCCRRGGLRKSRTIHRCSTSSSLRCCLVVVQLSAPHITDVVIVASKSWNRRLSVACFCCKSCFWLQ